MSRVRFQGGTSDGSDDEKTSVWWFFIHSKFPNKSGKNIYSAEVEKTNNKKKYLQDRFHRTYTGS